MLIAGALLVGLLPLMLVIALVIALDSPGPVIFAQQRIRGRRVIRDSDATWLLEPFTLYKFRTMRADADPTPHREYMAAYLSADEDRLRSLRPGRQPGDSYRPAHDPRLTSIGCALRALSLDELPQLWNVLRGQMSLVGPRPPLPYEVELYDDPHMLRLAAPLGITGWAQVNGRCAIDFQQMLGLDLDYIQRRSILLDLAILLRTFPVVLWRRGAD